MTEGSTLSRSTVLRQAYGAATQRLREAHKDEFNRYHAEEAKARGVDWKPRPTEEDRAREQMRALLQAHPSLLDEIKDDSVALHEVE